MSVRKFTRRKRRLAREKNYTRNMEVYERARYPIPAEVLEARKAKTAARKAKRQPELAQVV